MGRPKAKEGDNFQDRRVFVMETAANLFARQGVDAVSMRDLGRACELHISSLYHYFASKEELYAAVRNWAYDVATRVAIEAIDVGDTPEQRIESFVRSMTLFFLDDGAAMGVLEREILRFNGTDPGPLAFPEIMRLPLLKLTAEVEALGSDLLTHLPSERITELLWDLAWGVTRYLPAHAAVTPARFEGRPPTAVSDEVWLLAKRILGIPL